VFAPAGRQATMGVAHIRRRRSAAAFGVRRL